MRKIDKGDEPPVLRAWKKRHPHGRYRDLSHEERVAIRVACTAEQYFLCGYCCDSISGAADDTVNEHLEAQERAPDRTLDFDNLIASCKATRHCDGAHRARALPLTPLMPECEVELRYKLSGRVEGLTDRARETIRVLNLGDTEQANKGLIEKRRRLCDALLMANGVDLANGLDDDELIKIVVDDLSQPKSQRLETFAPVVVNIVRGWLGR